MKLIAQVKLLTTGVQTDALKHTMEQANTACQFVSDRAWETKTFRQYDLHHLCYRDVRERFGLSAQVTVRAIAKVADAYKLDRKTKRTFKPHGAVSYDERILRWYVAKSEVSIWTTAGRQHIPFACGERQRVLLQNQQGETDLVYHRDQFYLLATCNVQEPTPHDVDDVLGIDMGIANIVADSDGEMYSGEKVEARQRHYERLRSGLQRVGTKSSRRKLKCIRHRERRFKHDTNHVVSKHLVAKAKDTGRDLAIEDLRGIRDRTTFRKARRSQHSKWAFLELRQFVTYKAALAGVRLHVVDPRFTSKACSVCGCIDDHNRPNQATFLCVSCGYACHADTNAAQNIRAKAVVNRLKVSDAMLVAVPGTSLRLQPEVVDLPFPPTSSSRQK